MILNLQNVLQKVITKFKNITLQPQKARNNNCAELDKMSQKKLKIKRKNEGKHQYTRAMTGGIKKGNAFYSKMSFLV